MRKNLVLRCDNPFSDVKNIIIKLTEAEFPFLRKCMNLAKLVTGLIPEHYHCIQFRYSGDAWFIYNYESDPLLKQLLTGLDEITKTDGRFNVEWTNILFRDEVMLNRFSLSYTCHISCDDTGMWFWILSNNEYIETEFVSWEQIFGEEINN